MDIEELLSKLTLNEKSLLIAGTNFMYTYAIKDLKIPSIRMSDGPHGLGVQNGEGDKQFYWSEWIPVTGETYDYEYTIN